MIRDHPAGASCDHRGGGAAGVPHAQGGAYRGHAGGDHWAAGRAVHTPRCAPQDGSAGHACRPPCCVHMLTSPHLASPRPPPDRPSAGVDRCCVPSPSRGTLRRTAAYSPLPQARFSSPLAIAPYTIFWKRLLGNRRQDRQNKWGRRVLAAFEGCQVWREGQARCPPLRTWRSEISSSHRR